MLIAQQGCPAPSKAGRAPSAQCRRSPRRTAARPHESFRFRARRLQLAAAGAKQRALACCFACCSDRERRRRQIGTNSHLEPLSFSCASAVRLACVRQRRRRQSESRQWEAARSRLFAGCATSGQFAAAAAAAACRPLACSPLARPACLPRAAVSSLSLSLGRQTST